MNEQHARRAESEILYTLTNYLLSEGANELECRLNTDAGNFTIQMRAKVSLSDQAFEALTKALSLPRSETSGHYYSELLARRFRDSDLTILGGMADAENILYEEGVLTIKLRGQY